MDMDAIHPIQPPNFPAGLHVKVEMLTQSRSPPPFAPRENRPLTSTKSFIICRLLLRHK